MRKSKVLQRPLRVQMDAPCKSARQDAVRRRDHRFERGGDDVGVEAGAEQAALRIFDLHVADGCGVRTALDRMLGRPHIQVLGQSLMELLPLAREGKLLPAESHPVHLAMHLHAENSGGYQFHAVGRDLTLTISWKQIVLDSRNASVAFVIGTTITFINQNAGGTITIAITSDTMRLAGAGTTGSRSLAANGIATAVKVTSTEWLISGTGLT